MTVRRLQGSHTASPAGLVSVLARSGLAATGVVMLAACGSTPDLPPGAQDSAICVERVTGNRVDDDWCDNHPDNDNWNWGYVGDGYDAPAVGHSSLILLNTGHMGYQPRPNVVVIRGAVPRTGGFTPKSGTALTGGTKPFAPPAPKPAVVPKVDTKISRNGFGVSSGGSKAGGSAGSSSGGSKGGSSAGG